MVVRVDGWELKVGIDRFVRSTQRREIEGSGLVSSYKLCDDTVGNCPPLSR